MGDFMTAIKPLYVSFSRLDAEAVAPIRKALEARGVNIIVNDKHSPENPKSGWHSFVRYQIPMSYALLIILTPHSASWEWFNQEIEQANAHRLPIFVVHLANPLVHLPALATLDIRRVHIPQPRDFEQGVEQLLQWLMPLQAASDQKHLTPLVENLVLMLPSAQWAAVVTTDGLLEALYQRGDAPDDDRITAMSAAYLGVSERAAHDFMLGRFRYTFLAGEQGAALTMLIGDSWLLTLCFDNVISYDAIFQKLPELLQPIWAFFKVPPLQF